MKLEPPSYQYRQEDLLGELAQMSGKYPVLCQGLKLVFEKYPDYQFVLGLLGRYPSLVKPRIKQEYLKASLIKQLQREQLQKALAKQQKIDKLERKKRVAVQRADQAQQQPATGVVKVNQQLDESFENRLSEINIDLLKAKCLVMFCNYEMSYLTLKNIITIQSNFLETVLPSEQILNLKFYQAYVLFKDQKFEESGALLRSLHTLCKQLKCEKSITNLKIVYYYAHILFIKNQYGTAQQYLEYMGQLLTEMHIDAPLAGHYHANFHLLRAKIYSDLNAKKKAIQSFNEALKWSAEMSRNDQALVYCCLGVEYYSLALYEVAGQYFSKVEKQYSDTSSYLMCLGYKIDICEILCTQTQMYYYLSEAKRVIRANIITDTDIEQMLDWCNLFSKYFSTDSEFLHLGDMIVTCIEKSSKRLGIKLDYMYHVFGQIYYHTGAIFKAERYFEKCMSQLPNGDQAHFTIYMCLSYEWLAYITSFIHKNQTKGSYLYQDASDVYETFVRNNRMYKKIVIIRQAYIQFHLNNLQEGAIDIIQQKNLFELIQNIINLEDNNRSDKKLEYEFLFLRGLIYLQLSQTASGVECLQEAINSMIQLFIEAPMMGVRLYQVAMVNCLILGAVRLAGQFGQSCMVFIEKNFRTEDDYSDFMMLYGYIEYLSLNYE